MKGLKVLRGVLFFLIFTIFLNAQIRISPMVYQKISMVQNLSNNKKYSQALQILQKAMNKKLKKEDQAYLLQSLGFVYIAQNNYKKAIENFERMNKLNVMDKKTYLSTTYNLSQLYMTVGKNKKAIECLKIWLKNTEKIEPKAYLLLGQNYSLLKNFNKAVLYTNKAIENQDKAKKSIPKNWYELLFSNCYSGKKYKCASDALNKLIKIDTKNKKYWIYLSQIYNLQGKSDKSLSVFEQIYNLNIFTPKDIIYFSKFLFQNELYYKSALFLNKNMKSKNIKENEKNLNFLYNAYFNAKEYKEALLVLNKLIKKSKKSNYVMKKARLLTFIHEYEKAVLSYENVLKNKKIKDYYKGNLELSYLYYELEEYEKCKKCLKIVLNDEKNRKIANTFLNQLKIY